MLPNALCKQSLFGMLCIRRVEAGTSNYTWLESTSFEHKGKVTAYQSQDQWQSLVLQPRREKEKLTRSLWPCARHAEHRLQLDEWSQLGKQKR